MFKIILYNIALKNFVQVGIYFGKKFDVKKKYPVK